MVTTAHNPSTACADLDVETASGRSDVTPEVRERDVVGGEDTGDGGQAQAKRARLTEPRRDYTRSGWGLLLATLDSLHKAGELFPSDRDAKEFKRCFRVPYEKFLPIVDMARPWFTAAVTDDVAQGDIDVPLELKLMAVLKLMGGRNLFSDAAMMACISEETVAKSFDVFCKNFPAHLWKPMLRLPRGPPERSDLVDTWVDPGLHPREGSLAAMPYLPEVDSVPGAENFLSSPAAMRRYFEKKKAALKRREEEKEAAKKEEGGGGGEKEPRCGGEGSEKNEGEEKEKKNTKEP